MPKSNFVCSLNDKTGLISLFAPNNCQIDISTLGASVCKVYTKDRYGNLQNIAMPSIKKEDYAGATLGPVAGRIKGAILPINDKQYSLDANEGQNTLHGGTHSLSRMQWQIFNTGANKHCAFAELRCFMPDGLDGFMGNRLFRALFSLSKNALTIRYSAVSDKATFVNMSNHIYWNLSGDFTQNCYDHKLELSSDRVIYNDNTHLPLFTKSVLNTAFDFSKPTTLNAAMNCAKGGDIYSDKGQLNNAHGYNNAFALRKSSPFAARLTDPESTRRLTISTSSPYLVVYSGGYLPISGAALALEPQGKPNYFYPILYPGQKYIQTIRFTFDCL